MAAPTPQIQVVVDHGPTWADIAEVVAASAGVLGVLIAALVAAYGIKQGRDIQSDRKEERRREWLAARFEHLGHTHERLLALDDILRRGKPSQAMPWLLRLENDSYAIGGTVGDALYAVSQLQLESFGIPDEVTAAIDAVQDETRHLARELRSTFLGARVKSVEEAA